MQTVWKRAKSMISDKPMHCSVGRSGLRLRTYMSPCRYSRKQSLFSLYTISASFDGQPGKNSGLSYSQPDTRSNVVRKIDCSAATHTSIYSEDLVNDSSHIAEEKIGVLLLNLGGPDTLNDVQPFLFNLFADPVCSLHWFVWFCQPLKGTWRLFIWYVCCVTI